MRMESSRNFTKGKYIPCSAIHPTRYILRSHKTPLSYILYKPLQGILHPGTKPKVKLRREKRVGTSKRNEADRYLGGTESLPQLIEDSPLLKQLDVGFFASNNVWDDFARALSQTWWWGLGPGTEIVATSVPRFGHHLVANPDQSHFAGLLHFDYQSSIRGLLRGKLGL